MEDENRPKRPHSPPEPLPITNTPLAGVHRPTPLMRRVTGCGLRLANMKIYVCPYCTK